MWTLKQRAKYWTPEKKVAHGKKMKEIWDIKMAAGYKFSESRNNKISQKTTGVPKTLTLEQREAHSARHRGNKYHWKGGRKMHNKGYFRVHIGTGEHGESLYAFEQRKMMEDYLGYELSDNEIVHHINGIKTDNRIENLQVMTKAEHINHHRNRKEEVKDVRHTIGNGEEGAD